MSKVLVSQLFAQLVAESVPGGRITPAHIAAFLDNPERVFPDGIVANEKLIGLIPKKFQGIDELSLHDGKPLYRARQGETWDKDVKYCVVWGEAEGKPCDRIGDEVQERSARLILADGKPLYRAKQGEQWCVVWGDAEGKPYEYVDWPTLAEGKPLYWVRQDRKEFVVWGEAEGKRYPEVSRPFLADGRIVYSVRLDDEKHCLVRGEAEGEAHDHIYSFDLVDGKPLYTVGHEKRCFIVFGEEKGVSYDCIHSYDHPYYASAFFTEPVLVQGELLYAVKVGEALVVKHGEREIARFDQARRIDHLMITDSTLMCVVKTGHLHFHLVCGEFKSKTFEGIHWPSCADGKPLYVAYINNRPGFMGSGSMAVVWGEAEGKQYRSVSEPIIAEGKVLYAADDGDDGMFVVWGGEEGFHYDEIGDLRFVNGKPVYWAKQDGKSFVVWGDFEGKPYDEVFSLEVEKDRIVYGAKKGRRIYEVSILRR